MPSAERGPVVTTVTLYGPKSADWGGAKIPAIKFVKNVHRAVYGTHLGLRDAKNIVDRWEPNVARTIEVPDDMAGLIIGYASAVGIRTYTVTDSPAPLFSTDDIPF